MPTGVYKRRSETIEKMRKLMMGNKINLGRTGMIVTEETKIKIRIAQIGIKRPNITGKKHYK